MSLERLTQILRQHGTPMDNEVIGKQHGLKLATHLGTFSFIAFADDTVFIQAPGWSHDPIAQIDESLAAYWVPILEKALEPT